MAVSVVDNVNTQDSGSLTTRNITKATQANLAAGDWSVIFASGNLNPAPTIDISALPGFSQPDARIFDSPDTYLDILIRKWDASSISGLGSETWTIAYSGTSKGQYPCITFRGIDSAATHPFSTFSGSSEAGVGPTQHVTNSITVPSGDGLVTCIVDRLTGGVTYTQNGASDTELLNSIGPGTNAISQGVWFNAAPSAGATTRTYDLSAASSKAVMYIAAVKAASGGGPPPGTLQGTPKIKYWNGSAWVISNKLKYWTGTAWATPKARPYT